MTYSQAIVPNILTQQGNTWPQNVLCVFGGVLLLSLLSQLSIPLPFTPVPITGQTFGVIVIALCWGSQRGAVTLGAYLSLGALGLPLFAMGGGGWNWGPTSGYLIGMFVAAYAMGKLSDYGWANSFRKCWLAGLFGTALIFIFGLLGLSFFLPANELIKAGLLPFLPGAVIKITFAASVVVPIQPLKSEREV